MIEISIALLITLCCMCFSLGIEIANLIWVINVFRGDKYDKKLITKGKMPITKNRHCN